MEEIKRRKLVVELEAIIELDRFFDSNDREYLTQLLEAAQVMPDNSTVYDCCRAALNRKACEPFDAEVVQSAMKMVAGFVRDMNNVEQDIPLVEAHLGVTPHCLCNREIKTVKDLEHHYLRGYMFVESSYDVDAYLFLEDGKVACMHHSGDGYRDYCWDFTPVVAHPPERDSRYKAIGEYINSVAVNDGSTTYQVQIATNTKRIDFTTDNVDDYYPNSIWDVI